MFSKYSSWLIQKINNLLTRLNKLLQKLAAGKAIAAKTKQAREAQRKALADALIENNQLKQAAPPVADTPTAAPPVESESTKNVLTTTKWLSVISIFVSLAGIYCKREEIKSFLSKKPPQNVDATPKAPPPSPVDVVPKRKGGIPQMD